MQTRHAPHAWQHSVVRCSQMNRSSTCLPVAAILFAARASAFRSALTAADGRWRAVGRADRRQGGVGMGLGGAGRVGVEMHLA